MIKKYCMILFLLPTLFGCSSSTKVKQHGNLKADLGQLSLFQNSKHYIYANDAGSADSVALLLEEVSTRFKQLSKKTPLLLVAIAYASDATFDIEFEGVSNSRSSLLGLSEIILKSPEQEKKEVEELIATTGLSKEEIAEYWAMLKFSEIENLLWTSGFAVDLNLSMLSQSVSENYAAQVALRRDCVLLPTSEYFDSFFKRISPGIVKKNEIGTFSRVLLAPLLPYLSSKIGVSLRRNAKFSLFKLYAKIEHARGELSMCECVKICKKYSEELFKE